jgi:hypothetical protein
MGRKSYWHEQKKKKKIVKFIPEAMVTYRGPGTAI